MEIELEMHYFQESKDKIDLRINLKPLMMSLPTTTLVPSTIDFMK